MLKILVFIVQTSILLTKNIMGAATSTLQIISKSYFRAHGKISFICTIKKQYFPNQDLKLILKKRMGQLCQDDDCKESWEGLSTFPWCNSFSTISSPNKWNGWEQVYALRPGWARKFMVAVSLPQNRWMICSNMVKLTAMFLLHITQGFHMTIQHNMSVGCRRKLVFTRLNSPRMSITSTIGAKDEI